MQIDHVQLTTYLELDLPMIFDLPADKKHFTKAWSSYKFAVEPIDFPYKAFPNTVHKEIGHVTSGHVH